ncbi:MAG: hypothetical protein Q9211_001795 [Gyalolechia sp. 1 TL-2023]
MVAISYTNASPAPSRVHLYKSASPRMNPSPGARGGLPAPVAGVCDAAVDDPRPGMSAKERSKVDGENQSGIEAEPCLQMNDVKKHKVEPHTSQGGRLREATVVEDAADVPVLDDPVLDDPSSGHVATVGKLMFALKFHTISKVLSVDQPVNGCLRRPALTFCTLAAPPRPFLENVLVVPPRRNPM